MQIFFYHNSNFFLTTKVIFEIPEEANSLDLDGCKVQINQHEYVIQLLKGIRYFHGVNVCSFNKTLSDKVRFTRQKLMSNVTKKHLNLQK